MNHQPHNTSFRKPTQEEFLAPLMVLKEAHQMQALDLHATRIKMNLMMSNVLKSHEALPSYLRPRQLFALEEEMVQMAALFRDTRDKVKVAINDLHQIAKDALNVDPLYREGALRIVHDAEMLAKGNVQTLDVMIAELDLTNSRLLTVH